MFLLMDFPLIARCTVSPKKHENSVTIFNLSTSVQLGCKINVWRGCVPASQAEVDLFNIVAEFPCLLGHTVTYIHNPKASKKFVYSRFCLSIPMGL